jgi:4-amino-4-deoxy-L-arabinose transferase-like glycosyltransferase
MPFKVNIDEGLLYKLILGFTFAAMLINLGVQPLYLEEPRRAIVAMEMLQSGNYIASTLLGEWYYNKPPVYNWILLISAQMFGGFTEFAFRFPTVLSMFAICIIMIFMGKKYLGRITYLAAPLIFICGSSLLFYFSFLAEIDIFYSLITFIGIVAIYYFGAQQKYYLLFLSVYLLCTIGFLTKGLPSLPFTAISLLVYFIDQKKWQLLFSPAHIAGIALFTLIISGYIYLYSGYNNPVKLLETFISESGDRTAASMSVMSLLRHLIVFPFDLLKDFMPAGIIILFLFRSDIRHFLLQRNDWIRYCTLIFFFNLLLYWISPGTRMRYVYPIYPFMAFILAWSYENRKELSIRQDRIFQVITGTFLLTFFLGTFAIFLIPDLDFLHYRLFLAAAAVMAFGFLFFVWWQNRSLSLALLFCSLAIGRLVFDLTVFPQRSLNSEAQRNKELAEKVISITKNDPLHLYGSSKVISYTTSFYLNKERSNAVILSDSLLSGHFYIMPASLRNKKDSIYMNSTYQNKDIVLIKHTAK